ncbi:energy transducer TonB [Gaetbulibacter sp. NE]|uniref:energy transducer TonB n=1 Tax=Gaetbulibacter sp. NE TaxID=2982307 RepID=UPI0021D10FA0|nr:energy transducer TonB [Gaetbulibacter sp. NE]
MKPHYSISIPKPCHENWSKMTPNEKGRFCQSCSKTVVDFTTMTTDDIQDFIHNNKHQRICGHIKQSQLDTINLKVSQSVFDQTLSFHKMFLLALLLAMGTTIFSCADEKGNTKKIESIELIDTKTDTIEKMGEIDTDVEQILNETLEKTSKKDSTEITAPPFCPIPNVTGEVIEVEEQMEDEEDVTDIVVGMIINSHPKFPNTPDSLSIQGQKEYLNKQLREFIEKNFDIENAKKAGLSGKQKMYIQFTIDEQGITKDIIVRSKSPHPYFDKETTRVMELLPQFIPAKQRDKNVASIYSLPIIFDIKD